jgi:hypothetical protein
VTRLRTIQELGERFGIAEELQAISVLSAAEGLDRRAGELAGAAHALWDSMSAQPLAADWAIASPYLDSARGRVGPSNWRAAWRRGQAMGLDEGIAHALAKQGMSPSEPV